MTELHLLAVKNDYDVIGITETWARSDILDPEYAMGGYSLFRKDGTAGHGGVMLYIKHELRPVICSEFLSNGLEDTVWCYIINDIGEKVVIDVVYRSPNSESHNNDRLLKLVQMATAVKNVNRLLMFGYFLTTSQKSTTILSV